MMTAPGKAVRTASSVQALRRLGRPSALDAAMSRRTLKNSLAPACPVQPIPAIASSTAHTAAVSSAAWPVAIAAA